MKKISTERPQQVAIAADAGKWYLTVNIDIRETVGGYEYLTHSTTIDHEPTDADITGTARQAKLAALEEYDVSDAVNGFEVVKDGQTITTWIEPDKRSNYRGSLDDCVLMGVTDIEVPIAGMLIPMTVADARAKLAQIQLYADRCTIVTESHKAAILALQTVEEVEQYDFTVGYPSKLVYPI